MSETGKYSVQIIAKSGDRVLTDVTYPEQSYADFVGVQAIIAMALVRAGFDRAELLGFEVPEVVKNMFNPQSKKEDSGVIR